MRTINLLSAFYLTICQSNSLNAQVQARFHEAFETKTAKKLDIKVDKTKHQVVFKESHSTAVLIEITVLLDHASPAEMEEFIAKGRYALEAEYKNDQLILKHKTEPKTMTIKGQQADELIIYTVSIPRQLSY